MAEWSGCNGPRTVGPYLATPTRAGRRVVLRRHSQEAAITNMTTTEPRGSLIRTIWPLEQTCPAPRLTASSSTTPIYTPQGYGSAYTENALQPSLYGVTRTVHPPVTLYRAAAPNERNPTRNEQADDSEDEDAARKASVQEDDPSEGEPEQTVRDETEGEDEPSTARLPLAMEPSEDRLDDGVTRPGLDQRRRVSSGRVKVYVDREGNIYETSSSDRPLRQNDNGSQRSPAAALGADMRRLSISQSENRRAGVTDAEYLEPQLYQRMGPAAISGNPPQTEELDRRA